MDGRKKTDIYCSYFLRLAECFFPYLIKEQCYDSTLYLTWSRSSYNSLRNDFLSAENY